MLGSSTNDTNMIFLEWFFSTPTPIITVLSLAVAYGAYLYQRKWNRKQRAQQIAEWYCKIAIPKSRYINKILSISGNLAYAKKFHTLEHFTTEELKTNLEMSDGDEQMFISNFEKISEKDLDNAYADSGCSKEIYEGNCCLKEAIRNSDEKKYIIFDKYIVDFLNEMEDVALQLNCNLADEKLIYPILHQTFLKNVQRWYYFIAKENQLNHNRYYPNLIALYLLWYKRSKREAASYNRINTWRNRRKKI